MAARVFRSVAMPAFHPSLPRSPASPASWGTWQLDELPASRIHVWLGTAAPE